MTTAFKALNAALVAALVAAPALAGGRVYANRLRPIQQAHSTAVVVRLVASQSQEIALGALDWSTQFAIECLGRGTTGADPVDAVDALLLAVWPRLASLDAAALGAMAVVVDAGVEWQFDEGEASSASATLRLTVQHRTTTASLTAWP